MKSVSADGTTICISVHRWSKLCDSLWVKRESGHGKPVPSHPEDLWNAAIEKVTEQEDAQIDKTLSEYPDVFSRQAMICVKSY